MWPIMLLLFFSVASTFGALFEARPKVWARRRGRLTLCGPNGGMWTQVGRMMNGVIMNRRGVIYVDEGAGSRNQN